MANILVSVVNGIEVSAEDVLKFITGAETKVQAYAPGAVAALGVLLGAVEKAIGDTQAAAANPATLVLNLGTDITDIKAVWPDVKAMALALGIKL